VAHGTRSELAGYVPEGMKKIKGLWGPPVSEYVPHGSEGAGLPMLSIWYVLSALCGAVLIAGLFVIAAGGWLAGKPMASLPSWMVLDRHELPRMRACTGSAAIARKGLGEIVGTAAVLLGPALKKARVGSGVWMPGPKCSGSWHSS